MAPVGSGQLRIVSVSFEEATLVMFEVGFVQLPGFPEAGLYLKVFPPHSRVVSEPSPMALISRGLM